MDVRGKKLIYGICNLRIPPPTPENPQIALNKQPQSNKKKSKTTHIHQDICSFLLLYLPFPLLFSTMSPLKPQLWVYSLSNMFFLMHSISLLACINALYLLEHLFTIETYLYELDLLFTGDWYYIRLYSSKDIMPTNQSCLGDIILLLQSLFITCF